MSQELMHALARALTLTLAPGVMDRVVQELIPIGILCVVITLVVLRLPRVDVGHSAAFRRRRVLNWLPLGLTYAFLYMGRYNFNALMDNKLITQSAFGQIEAVGSIVYGLSFLLNGPLTDRWGGRTTMLIAAAGAAACNGAVGISMAMTGATVPHIATVVANAHAQFVVMPTTTLVALYGLNMYFQSFGAVAIVKVNASWFHLRERGTFGGIFGILISIGLYLAYDWAPNIAKMTAWPWLFLTPALCLVGFWVWSFLAVRDTPAEAGLADFDVADASSGETGPPDPALVIIKRMLTNKVLLIIAAISLCSGFIRQGILKWFRTFANGVAGGKTDAWIPTHWGMVSCVAGITGGMFAGIVSDHLFKSRRPPVASVLFSLLLGGALAIIPFLDNATVISGIVAFMAMSVIGVHGMLSGVASQDFGGRRNAGTATGLIDGFVYFGSALQGMVYGALLPEKGTPAAADTHAWLGWPIAMVPMAVIGLGLSLTILKAVVPSRAPQKV